MECSVEGHSELTMEEHLDKLCVYYMSLGVPYEVFWHGDFCCLKYYEEVYMNQRKLRNEEMWMQGIYNYKAHETVLGNAFRGKGTAQKKYLDKPMEFFPKTEDEQKAEAERIRKHLIDNLNKLKREWDKKNVCKDS